MSTTSAQAAQQASTPAFITSLVLNVVVLAVEVIIFTVVRRWFRAIYEPRAYIPEESKRSPPLSQTLLGWPLSVWNADITTIQHVNGLDAYMFVRFLRMMCYMLLPIWIISWIILLPTYAVHTDADPPHTGLDRYTFGNVAANMQQRYTAPMLLAWIFTFWIFYTIWNEMREYVILRQRHLISPSHSSTAQANTVLITGVPKKFLDEKVLAGLFRHLPGGAKKVWLNRDLKELPDLHARRVKACSVLENAENALMEKAIKLKRKREKAAAKKSPQAEDEAPMDPEKSLSLADRLVPRDQRPTRRLPWKFIPISLPLIGEKVDAIEWARKEIIETSESLKKGRAELEKDVNTPGTGSSETYPPLNSAFVLFNQQIAAHLAVQSLTHNEPYRMAMKHIEMAPEDVIWANLGLNPYEIKVRTAISFAVSVGLILAWSFPVAFVGAVSNINHLCSYSWLAWICKLPSVVVGIISGVLPPLGLAILMMLLPIILRLLARFEGIPRYSGLELSLMSRYFLFLVVNGFLITTLSSGIIAALPEMIQSPENIPKILGSQLPLASTFFLTYVTLQGLSGGGGGLLQAVPLVMYYAKLFILGSTPRSIYEIKYIMRNVAWGTTFPSMTLIAVITLTYSVISPVINGLSCLSFFIYYFVWKYLFLWQMDQPPSGDTGGLYFPMAMNHLFVGLYIEQVCLAALFLLTSTGTPTAVPEGILMIVLIVVTALFQHVLNESFGPLLHSLPLTLAHKSYGMPPEEGDDQQDVQPLLHPNHADDGFLDVANNDRNAVALQPRGNADIPNVEGRTEVTSNKDRIQAGDNEKAVAAAKEENQQVDKSADGLFDDGPTDFYHPATVEPQPVVWIAQDTLGIGQEEVAALLAMGIKASDHDASMDEKGNVEIYGVPPGEHAVDEDRDT